jgi:hypothetical protein
MAVDDVTVTLSVNLAAGAGHTRQPAGGVEEIAIGFAQEGAEGSAPNEKGAIAIFRIDGTNNDAQMYNGNSGNQVGTYLLMRIHIDNTNYMQQTNYYVGAGDSVNCTIVQG